MSAHDSPSGLLGQLVSSCPHCGEVFGLPGTYATGDELICPLCERQLAPEQIAPRTLRIAPLMTSSDDSDSVLDSHGDDRDHASDSETSLSGIEIGSLFDGQTLKPPAADPTSHKTPASLFDSSLETPSPPEPPQDEAPEESPPSEPEEPASEPPVEMAGLREDPDSVLFENEPAEVPPAEEMRFDPPEQESPKQDAVPHIERSPQDDLMTAQLIGGGAERRGAPRWIVPAVVGALLLIGGPLAYLAIVSMGSDTTPQRVAIVDAPDPMDAQQEDSAADAPDPGAIVANYEVPVSDDTNQSNDPVSEPSSPLGDRYSSTAADVPAFLDEETEADPEAIATVFDEEVDSGYEGERNQILLGAPVYSYEELFTATAEGRQAGRTFAEGSLDDTESFEAMGRDFAKLCYLAQVVTLLDPKEDHFDLMTAQLEAVDVFKRALSSQASRDHAAQIAGPWLDWTSRPHGGVFFVGNVKGSKESGDYFEYTFAYGDFQATVITSEPISYRRFRNAGAKEVGVLGVIVEDPATHLPDYEGDAPRVIWARKTVPLR